MSHMKVIKAETKKQQEQVLKILDELDYLWNNNKRPIRYIPSEDLGKKYIYIYCYTKVNDFRQALNAVWMKHYPMKSSFQVKEK